jgi:hypothetical protein
MACNTIFTRKTIFAALFAIGAAGSAQAQGVGNIVGGGSGTITGGGDDAQITYSMVGAGGGGGLIVQLGRLAAFAGSDGDGPRLNYGAPPDGNPGGEARMIGGGDDTQVVYVSPR